MDNFFLNGELTHFFGEKDWDAAATLDRDYDSWGGMLQVGAKLDALTPSLMYIYASGQDRNATAANGGDIESFLTANGTGDLFEPLYILTGRHTGMLNNDIFAVNTAMTTAGVHAVIAAADYAVSNQLKLHGAIGYAQADEAETATYTNRDDEYGWEYNIGAAYKLLDNLTYEAHFGYLDTGDFFKSTATTDDTENVYVLTHSLTMTF
jgi:opacity protein-like surface antigen